MQRRPITVTVVSGSPVVPAGLERLLGGDGSPVELVAFDDAATSDIVLFDPTGHVDADAGRLEELVADQRFTHVVVFGAAWSKRAISEAQRIGVSGFLPKTMPSDDLVRALVDIASGAKRTRERYRPGTPPPAWIGRDDGLTARESQVLALCADGLSNQEIADTLFVNVETVKSHLKRAYHRLGLRNRAQAAAYVHRTAPIGPLQAIDWAPVGAAAAAARGPAPVLTIPDAEVADRLRVMRLTGDRREALRPLAPAVESGAEAFVDGLVARWSQHAETASLVADDDARARLVEHQRRYLSQLMTGTFDGAHAAAVVRIGAVHHRLRVSPQWYLASCAHLVCDHLDIVLQEGGDVGERLEVLIASVLFDAALVLDAYELAVIDEIRRDADLSEADMAAPPPAVQPAEPPRRRGRSMAKVTAGRDQASSRRDFLGIDDAVIGALRGLVGTVDAAMPEVLDGFYSLAGADPAIDRFFEPSVLDRLRSEVSAFWHETTTGAFDVSHAASRLRVGVIHEQIGLVPQWYLAGLAAHLAGLLRAVVGSSDDVRRDVDALIRAAFFDATFVIDAYLEARASSLLQTGRFASQVVTGLANGVAIVDSRDRIEFANDQFLDLVGVSPGVLHRMPLDSALPIAGIRDLIDAARSAASGRATAMHTIRARTLRLIGLRLDGTSTGRGVLVAVVVDDISDVLRVGADIEREDRRFEQVLDAVDAMAWEADAETLLLLAVSRAAAGLTGRRHVDLLGRAAFTDLVDPDDAAAFVAACRGLSAGVHAAVDHGVRHADGSARRVRTTMVGTAGADGRPTVSGVTIPVERTEPV